MASAPEFSPTLSYVVDALTAEIEERDDERLRKARELVLETAMPKPARSGIIGRLFGRNAP